MPVTPGWIDGGDGYEISTTTGERRPMPGNNNPGSTGSPDDFPTFETPEIDQINLPTPERVDPRFGNEFDQWYSNVIDAQAGNVGDFYNYNTPQAGAAQMDLGAVPQPDAQMPESSEALQFLLSGQGFSPDIMARMQATNTDANAMVGRSNAGSARLMAEQAGLAGSPAAMAMEASARRQQGDATTRGSNAIEIANAQQGMQNRQMGAGLENSRQISGAAQANQMALQNAAMILSSMQQNVGNLQQTNMFNTGNEVGQKAQGANAQAGLYGAGAQSYNNAALGRSTEADFFNAAQSTAQGNNQATLNRQADMFNTGNSMQRYGWDTANLVNLANQTGANNYYSQGTGNNARIDNSSPWGNISKLGGN
jgi:hypothetical protein